MITDIIKKLINKRREKKKIARLINRVNSRSLASLKIC